ncbi:MAG: PaaI family thioesterase [Spirochaetota bacterium]
MSTTNYDVRNPFVGIEGYQCFGCDPENAVGLALEFHRDGDVVTTEWQPRTELEGYPGVVHGGIQATLADEIGGWYVYAVVGTAGVTKELSITYESSARVADGPLKITARGIERSAKQAVIEVEIHNAGGTRCALARITYALFSEAVARKRLYFPGSDAFRPEDA